MGTSRSIHVPTKPSAILPAAMQTSWSTGSGSPTNIQQVNNYIQANIISNNITGVHTQSADCSAVDGEGNIYDDYMYMYTWGTTHSYGIYSLDGCLSQKLEERCQLLYNPPICVTIIACAIVKVVCMFLAARLDREEPPLLTVGDAVASFLTRPDPTTAGMCWMGRWDVHVWKAWRRRPVVRTANNAEQCPVNEEYPDLAVIPRKLSRRKFWMQAASFWRWAVILLLYLPPPFL